MDLILSSERQPPHLANWPSTYGITENADIKVWVYQTCIRCTLLYGDETWAIYSRHERRLKHLPLLLSSSYSKSHMGNQSSWHWSVLEKAILPSLIANLQHRHLSWLGHLQWGYNGHIPKALLYEELVDVSEPLGRCRFRFKDIRKMDLKTFNINTTHWEDAASNMLQRKAAQHQGVRGWREVVERERGKRREQRRKLSRHQALVVCWLPLLAQCLIPASSRARTVAWNWTF